MPAPSIVWFAGQNRQPLQSSSQIRIGSDGTLHLSKVSKADGGVFTCRADNNIGSAISKTIQIRVNGKRHLSVKNCTIYRIVFSISS